MYMAFVIFIVSLTLLMRLCISLIFAILSPALLEFLRGLHDLLDQLVREDLFLLDLTSDLRMRRVKVAQHIHLELFDLRLLDSQQHLVCCRAQRDDLLMKAERMIKRLL